MTNWRLDRADRAAKYQQEKKEKDQEKQLKQEAKEAAEQQEEARLQASKRFFPFIFTAVFFSCDRVSLLNFAMNFTLKSCIFVNLQSVDKICLHAQRNGQHTV